MQVLTTGVKDTKDTKENGLNPHSSLIPHSRGQVLHSYIATDRSSRIVGLQDLTPHTQFKTIPGELLECFPNAASDQSPCRAAAEGRARAYSHDPPRADGGHRARGEDLRLRRPVLRPAARRGPGARDLADGGG